MHPFVLLKSLDLLTEAKTVLDVGTNDGAIAKRFADEGYAIEAIDIHEPEEAIPGVDFKKISVEDFLTQNTKTYDIVICRHVLHHLTDPKEVIKQLNDIASIFCFTCFGPHDDWVETYTTLEHREVQEMFAPETIRHRSETFQYSKTYAGEIKFWHIHTFVIENP